MIRAAISSSDCWASERRASSALDAVELLDQPGGRDRDRGLIRDRLDEPRVVGPPGLAPAGVDRERSEDPAGVEERRRHHRVDADLLDVVVRRRGVEESGVVEVVAGPRDARLEDGESGDPLLDLLVGVVRPLPGAVRRRRRRVVRPLQQAGIRVDQVDPGLVRGEQASGLVDGPLEDVAGALRRRDPGRDLAQALLLLGPPPELGPGAVQLGDQAGVLDRDRGLVGERLEELRPRFVVGVGPVAADGDRAERAVLAAERRGQDRAEAGRARRARPTARRGGSASSAR